MDPNTHSTPPSGPLDDDLAALEAAADRLAARDLDRLPDAALAERVLGLRRLLDGLEGEWLKELAAVDGRGAAGADQDQELGSTAAWLRGRLRMGDGAASSAVRTARALFRGRLAGTGQAVCAGELSPAHAQVLAQGTRELPAQVTAAAEPVLLATARRLDPGRLRRAVGYLWQVADPDGAEAARERRHGRRGLWLTPTLDQLVAIDGLLEAEAGQTVLAALEPLARPSAAGDTRSGSQRTADALTELARRALEGGRLPTTGGVRPQLAVVVELASLLGHPGSLGGETGWAGPLDPEACRRLACDGAVTRLVVSRQPGDGNHRGGGDQDIPDHGASTDAASSACDRGDQGCGQALGSAGWLEGFLTRLPPILGGAPSRWTWAGPPGSSPRPSGPPWPSGTGAVCFPTVPAPWPGARATICSPGWMGAGPICRIWPCCAGPIIGPSMRGAGDWPAIPMGGSPPSRPSDDSGDLPALGDLPATSTDDNRSWPDPSRIRPRPELPPAGGRPPGGHRRPASGNPSMRSVSSAAAATGPPMRPPCQGAG